MLSLRHNIHLILHKMHTKFQEVQTACFCLVGVHTYEKNSKFPISVHGSSISRSIEPQNQVKSFKYYKNQRLVLIKLHLLQEYSLQNKTISCSLA